MTRLTVPFTKSDAIDRITDIEHLRAVTHRMWEAFFASHSQSAHIIAVLMDYEPCTACMEHIAGEGQDGCERYRAWQAKVTAGFGSI